MLLRRSRHPWLNLVQYPFPTREFDAGEGWMSYVDEGRGRPILMVHGSPTWSYLWRHLIRGLSPHYRCLAPDHLGFGLSDKPRGADYSHQAHANRLEAFVERLDLREMTVVAHDSGVAAAMSLAIRQSHRVRDLVIVNGPCWSLREHRSAMKLAHLVDNPLNRFYYRALNAGPGFILPALFADRHRMGKSTQYQYLEPFRQFDERAALFAMIAGLRKSSVWHDALWSQRHRLQDKRILLAWGLKDPLWGVDELRRWQRAFPRAETAVYPAVGRYVPEEAGRLFLDEIRWFLISQPTLDSGLAEAPFRELM